MLFCYQPCFVGFCLNLCQYWLGCRNPGFLRILGISGEGDKTSPANRVASNKHGTARENKPKLRDHWLFARNCRRNSNNPARNSTIAQRLRPPGRARQGRDAPRSRSDRHSARMAVTAAACVGPISSNTRPPGARCAAKPRRNRAIGLQPVAARRQRGTRLVVAHLGLQLGHFRLRRYRAGSTRSDRTGPGSREPVEHDSSATRRQPAALRHCCRATASAACEMSVPMPRPPGRSASKLSSDAARPGAKIQNPRERLAPAPPRSASRCRAAGPAHPASPEPAPIKLPRAGDMRHRHPRRPLLQRTAHRPRPLRPSAA